LFALAKTPSILLGSHGLKEIRFSYNETRIKKKTMFYWLDYVPIVAVAATLVDTRSPIPTLQWLAGIVVVSCWLGGFARIFSNLLLIVVTNCHEGNVSERHPNKENSPLVPLLSLLVLIVMSP